MTLRLRFWMLAMDVADVLRLPHRWYLWTLRRASDATDWGDELARSADMKRGACDEPF